MTAVRVSQGTVTRIGVIQVFSLHYDPIEVDNLGVQDQK